MISIVGLQHLRPAVYTRALLVPGILQVMSMSSQPPQPGSTAGTFNDPETAAVYNKMAHQHIHPRGPWPMILKKVSEIAKPGHTVLDIASGPGEPALTIAKALPQLRVFSTDCSVPMTVQATEAAAEAGVKNMEVKVADMQALPFENASVDVLTCCYGFMFPEDKALALRECFRVLRPGGTLIATTWDKTNMINVVKDVMTAVLGKEPPPPPINPLALSEPGLFEGMLTDAGFTDVSTTTSTYPFDFGKDPAFQFKIGTLMVKDKLVELGAEAVAEEAYFKNIGKYTSKSPEGNLILDGNTFRLSVGTKK